MKIKEYVRNLVRANGLDIAIRIAHNSKKNSAPEVEATLPTGDIFFPKDRKGGSTKALRERTQIHRFWCNVLGTLQKEKA